jgi:DNA-directed RNA polymerase specialized sigma24 family protein
MWRWLAGIEMNLMRRVWDDRNKALPSTEALVGTAQEPNFEGSTHLAPALSAKLAVLWIQVQLNLTLMRNQRYALAVQLRFIDELSYADIAGVLDLGSADSAREYVRRGLAVLRDMLTADAPEDPPRA